MPEERLSSVDEQRLIGAVREAIAQTNEGADPSAALAKSASARNYNPEFVGRMVEMYNTSRTLAHLKQTKDAARAADFPMASCDKVLTTMFPKKAAVSNLTRGAGEMGKAANFMEVRRHEEPTMEKAACYLPDGGLKVKKVMDKLADMKRDLIDLRTKMAGARIKREDALIKLASYFRRPGHAAFEEVDTCVQSMFGKAGALTMDVVWGAAGTPHGEKRASAVEGPHLADMTKEPYTVIGQFIECSNQLAKYANEQKTLEADIGEFDKGFKARLANFHKGAGLLDAVLGAMAGDALKGSTVYGGKETAPGQKGLSEALASATDPAHETAIKSIETESMLQGMLANDPVISKYDPSDVVDAYNEISQFAPTSATQPVVLRGYLRRMLESSPNVQGRSMEGFEAGQLADIENKLRPKVEITKNLEQQKIPGA